MVTLVYVVKLARKFEIRVQRVFIDRERSSYNQSQTASIQSRFLVRLPDRLRYLLLLFV